MRTSTIARHGPIEIVESESSVMKLGLRLSCPKVFLTRCEPKHVVSAN